MVLRGMARWPNVPSVYGWLQLDRRGQWRIKGERIANAGLTEFIARNYGRDEMGRWFFQNGPQRVFVALDYLPYVLRAVSDKAGLQFTTHTGLLVQQPTGVWMDESGNLCIAFDAGAGSVHDQDLAGVLPWLSGRSGQIASEDDISAAMLADQEGGPTSLWLHCAGVRLPVAALRSHEAAALFHFIAHPAPAPGEPEC